MRRLAYAVGKAVASDGAWRHKGDACLSFSPCETLRWFLLGPRLQVTGYRLPVMGEIIYYQKNTKNQCSVEYYNQKHGGTAVNQPASCRLTDRCEQAPIARHSVSLLSDSPSRTTALQKHASLHSAHKKALIAFAVKNIAFVASAHPMRNAALVSMGTPVTGYRLPVTGYGGDYLLSEKCGGAVSPLARSALT